MLSLGTKKKTNKEKKKRKKQEAQGTVKLTKKGSFYLGYPSLQDKAVKIERKLI